MSILTRLQEEHQTFETFEANVILPQFEHGWGILSSPPKGQFSAIIVTTEYRLLIFQKAGHDNFYLVFSSPYKHFLSVEKTGNKKFSSTYGIEIVCVQPLVINLELAKSITIRSTVYKLWESYLEPLEEFSIDCQESILKDSNDGWQYMDLIKEYSRMGISHNIKPLEEFLNPKTLKTLEKHPEFFENPGNISVYMALPHLLNSIEQNQKDQEIERRFEMQDLNLGYKICESYPSIIVTPSAELQNINSVAAYRSEERIPVLSWSKPDSPIILRSSEPNQGFWGNSSLREHDINWLQEFTTQAFKKFIIIDARSVISTVGNKFKGKGTEDIEDYDFIDSIHHLNMVNIHGLRQSFLELRNIFCDFLISVNKTSFFVRKDTTLKSYHYSEIQEIIPQALSELEAKDIDELDDNDQAFLQKEYIDLPQKTENEGIDISEISLYEQIGDTKWLEHKSALIIGSRLIKENIHNGINVLIHCSDGWDRTSELSALSQILIDEYYRTTEGFSVLISKEFIEFGHKFGERNSETISQRSKFEEWSPVFFLFLEAVAWLQEENVEQFEFDEDFLLYLAYEYFDNKKGSFLFNCELELIYCNAPQYTSSVFNNVQRWKRRKIKGFTELEGLNGYVTHWESFWAMYLK